jgi:hypothetical protein
VCTRVTRISTSFLPDAFFPSLYIQVVVIVILEFQFVGDYLPCQFVSGHSESLPAHRLASYTPCCGCCPVSPDETPAYRCRHFGPSEQCRSLSRPTLNRDLISRRLGRVEEAPWLRGHEGPNNASVVKQPW